jgi:hypothetical protein
MGLEGLIGKGPPQKTHFRYVEPQELVPAVMTGGQLTEANRKFNRSVVGKSKILCLITRLYHALHVTHCLARACTHRGHAP